MHGLSNRSHNSHMINEITRTFRIGADTPSQFIPPVVEFIGFVGFDRANCRHCRHFEEAMKMVALWPNFRVTAIRCQRKRR